MENVDERKKWEPHRLQNELNIFFIFADTKHIPVV